MKRIIVLTASKKSIFEIAIKRLKRISGLHITIVGLEKKDEKD